MQTNQRKPTNLSLDKDLLAEAKMLKVNLSRAAEDGIRLAVTRTQREIWQAENAQAMESSNAFVKKQGLPLAKLRCF